MHTVRTRRHCDGLALTCLEAPNDPAQRAAVDLGTTGIDDDRVTAVSHILQRHVTRDGGPDVLNRECVVHELAWVRLVAVGRLRDRDITIATNVRGRGLSIAEDDRGALARADRDAAIRRAHAYLRPAKREIFVHVVCSKRHIRECCVAGRVIHDAAIPIQIEDEGRNRAHQVSLCGDYFLHNAQTSVGRR